MTVVVLILFLLAITISRMEKMKAFVDNKLTKAVTQWMNTPYYSLVLLVLTLVSHYFGLDVFLIGLISLLITVNYLFQKNMNCMLVTFLFMCTMISIQNSPGNRIHGIDVSYYFEPRIYLPIIVFVAIPAVSATYRAIANIVEGKTKVDGIFITSLVLGIAFLTNGVFSKDYTPLNLMFGSFMFFFFFVLFIATRPHVSVDESTLKGISYQVLIFALLPIGETVVNYIANYANGMEMTSRPDIFLGWGNKNTVGMLLDISIPFVLSLLRFEKRISVKIVTHAVFVMIIATVILTFSRQTYLAAILFLIAYTVSMGIVKHGGVRARYFVYGAAWITFVAVLLFIGEINGFFAKIGFDMSDNGRFPLYKMAIESFLSNKAFGKGFFFIGPDNFVGLDSIMPLACHDTILEMMGACGWFGIAAYSIYRLVSFKEIADGINNYNLYPFLSTIIFLAMSLVDIHLFDLLGTAVYIMLLSLSLSGKTINDKRNNE